MTQRDRAEVKANNRHGGDWGCSKWHHGDGTVKAQRKAHQAEAKKAKRSRRRLDKAIIEEEQAWDC